ncbi:methyltransferase domain-containing protein [Desulfocurvus sp.]|uniref:methyltransferase domain-containing protein n=1 Tax=Desulfocurvus sp. TaxID=2871698 RepID=UPI0025BA3287|nr:methyltransferase domain-containing protein [Desulfocurvus sp.]MCK9239686.1 methyltransferase domain-containing protein [Desulfocurvus sp.]
MTETAPVLTPAHLAEIWFTVRWTSAEADHEEHYLARKVAPRRDILPPGLVRALCDAGAGTRWSEVFPPGKLVPGPRPRKVAAIPRDLFKGLRLRGRLVEPYAGRFYPYALLSAHPGVRTADVRPAFRVLEAGGSTLTVDFNHPLAAAQLEVAARVERVYPRAGAVRGRLPDWVEDICQDGPGMQARAAGVPTDFAPPYALERADAGDDAAFYAVARPVAHIDATARGHLERVHAGLAAPGCRVLDLMTGAMTHLPPETDARVTGLGLGRADLEANARLDRRVEHDLNADPRLPLEDASFDLVLCSLSFEYLTAPGAVLAGALRVLRPGGTLAVSFSNRWFPEKVTALWAELHDFERMGLVLEHMRAAGFGRCRTVSFRNWPRPQDDPHIAQVLESDPLFVVTGTRP